MATFGNFTDGGNPGANDYIVGYLAGGGSGSDRRWLRSTFADPPTNDGDSLGTASLSWSDLFLASGGEINFANGAAKIINSGPALVMIGELYFDNGAADGPGISLASSGNNTWAIDNAAGVLRLVNGVIVPHNFFISTAQFCATTAVPAGGNAGIAILFSSTSGFGIFWGTGAPTLTAAQGSIYLRRDGGASTRLYSNTSGSNTWSAITSA